MKNYELQKILRQYDKNAEVRVNIWDPIEEKFIPRDFQVTPDTSLRSAQKATKLFFDEFTITDYEDENT